MILTRILQHDMHHSTRPDVFVPWIEYANLQLPAVISGSRGQFLVARRYHAGNIVRSGVFAWDSDLVDNLITELMISCYDLSQVEGWKNIFRGKKAASEAFDHILDEDNFGQPHICLVPSLWSTDQQQKFFGRKNLNDKHQYRKYCRVYTSSIPFPVFFSRPDMVGCYTQFFRGGHSIIVHNAQKGMAFCPVDEH